MINRSYQSPIGQLTLSAKAGRLLGIHFEGQDDAHHETSTPSQSDQQVLDEARWQLDEYFDGTRRRFDVPIALMGTPFQLEVWSILLRIPFGKSVSYRDLARLVGREGGARAVGMANAANPLPIIVPCHRVIGIDGSLTGFAGGVHAKRELLDLECVGAGLFVGALG